MESTINDIRVRSAKLNSHGYIYSKLLFRYALIYVIGFGIGLAAYYLFDFPFSDKINAYIYGHFDNLFKNCKNPFDYLRVLIDCSNVDIKHLFFIFTAGFTLFAGIAMLCVILYRGISLGFSVGYLITVLKNGMITFNSIEVAFAVFLCANAFIASAMIVMCTKSTVFSDEFRRMGGRKRVIFRSRVLYNQIFRLLMILGIILLINLLRCIINAYISA
ncbi:MAG: hypothetical protein GX303_07125 [Clostridiales bacterium]|nr:hypothetical protein [Clostridiales bacterium]